MRQGIIISWQAVIAGTVISAMAYVVLNVLCLAIGMAPPLRSMLQASSGVIGSRVQVSDGIVLMIFGLLSLFCGGFLAGRMLGSSTSRQQGIVQGLLIASIFFLFFFSPYTGVGLGPVRAGLPVPRATGPVAGGRGVGATVGFLGSVGQEVAGRAEVTDAVALALQGGTYRDPLPDVAGTLIGFFASGDTLSAKSYLLSEGVNPTDSDRKVLAANQAFLNQSRTIEASTREAVSVTSWILFMTLLIGTAFAALGGIFGMRISERLVKPEREPVSRAA